MVFQFMFKVKVVVKNKNPNPDLSDIYTKGSVIVLDVMIILF